MTIKCYTFFNDKNNVLTLSNYIYKHNHNLSLYYKFNFILLNDDNINKYIQVPKRFWDLEDEFKSEIVRFYILNKYGGIWLNPEIIIIKNINKLLSKFINTKKEAMFDFELEQRISTAVIFMLPNSTCSNYCVNYIENTLNTINNLMWDDLAYNCINSLYELHPELIIVNNYKTVKDSTHLVTWDQKPGYFKHKWFKIDPKESEQISKKIINNNNCYYISTSIIEKNNNIQNLNTVFKSPNSIYSYLIKPPQKTNYSYLILLLVILLIIICFMKF